MIDISKMKWGWKPDPRDPLDFHFAASPRILAELPPRWFGDEWCPPVRDQGASSSCCGFMFAGAHGYLQQRTDPDTVFVGSGYFPYWGGRVLGHCEDVDGGSTIRDTVKGGAKFGQCQESLWPSVDPATILTQPTVECYSEGQLHQLLRYKRIWPVTIESVKAAIASGYAVCGGVYLYESIRYAESDGKVPMPKRGERFVGGHAQWWMTYDDGIFRVKSQNSWGVEFGDKGYLWYPYEYIEDPKLCSDVWALQVVEEEIMLRRAA